MNLRETRLDRRLTQPQIVAKMKEVEPRVDVALYSKMESGICLPTPPLMGVILSVLDCPLHDIYALDEIAFPSVQPDVIEIPEEARVPVHPRKPDRRKGDRHRSCSYRSPAPVSGSAQRAAPPLGRSANDTKQPARPAGRK